MNLRKCWIKLKLKDFIKWFEKLVPLELQEDFDNCGLQFGNLEREINKILISLDLDDNCLNKAIRENYDLIITHHPVIFHPLKSIIETENSVNTRLIKAIKNDICIYSSHTNLDRVEFGVSDALANKVGLKNTKNLKEYDNNTGYGKYSDIDEIFAEDFIQLVKQNLKLDNVIVYGNIECNVNRIAVLGGSGGHFIKDCVEKNCDVFISSEFKHDQQIDAIDNNLILIDIGHYESEKFILEPLKKCIQTTFSDIKIDVNYLEKPTRKIF
ncbi:Nif3-like dinuclear metal center hexameric protein [Finegoldia magna]|uniref:Nif3-like dinuclear metal center hexameric protein n=1 Tax=Finegoldia magna TaxID=1260 RepID=UPI001D152CA8|nr:Nif3-like dinuclear metal center hexameric protein [Finegoldia magna]UEA70399.1 Nif3-like dinuclear metal center hexameric protein [Finegoldia magna]